MKKRDRLGALVVLASLLAAATCADWWPFWKRRYAPRRETNPFALVAAPDTAHL